MVAAPVVGHECLQMMQRWIDSALQSPKPSPTFTMRIFVVVILEADGYG